MGSVCHVDTQCAGHRLPKHILVIATSKCVTATRQNSHAKSSKHHCKIVLLACMELLCRMQLKCGELWGSTPFLSFLVQSVHQLISVQKWPCWHAQNTCRGQICRSAGWYNKTCIHRLFGPNRPLLHSYFCCRHLAVMMTARS